ncbi:MAG: glycosyltransferase [Nanoarchaeota archaeon]|nr:glycosyltransferase [Nanoarchaeota archaeon]
MDEEDEDSNQDDTNSEPIVKNNLICFLGNFPPKECGIATFTQDLSSAINKKFNPQLKSRIIALNDDNHTHDYDDNVIIEINKDDIDDYIETAKKINKMDEIKLICIQHEFGIFGGDHGNHILPFLEIINKPIAVIFHSVLPNPDTAIKRIVKSLCEKSSATIVMAKKAIEILKDDYGIDEEKIFFIPHGIPSVPFVDQESYKQKIGVQGKTLISTFGLLSRGKGMEYMIRAMPAIIKKHPNVQYLIIGETHPVVRREEGESYRNELMREVKKLGLKDHVKFYNKFLSLKEIVEHLLATDIYACTNLDKNQIVSGTLSYALGCGRIVVSSPIEYAKEFLSEDRGMIVKDRSPESYAEKIDTILSDRDLKKLIERKAYSYSRPMTWQNVAISYRKIFNKILKLKNREIERLPEIKLDHLKKMTDDFGMIQFCNHSDPDKKSGYTIDDNSRALIASVLHDKIFSSQESKDLSRIYLNFIDSCQSETGHLQNNVENENEISDAKSDDSFGRTIWALGYTINKSEDSQIAEEAERLIKKSIHHIQKIKSPRAVAFSIIGLYHYQKKYPNQETLDLIKKLADYLAQRYDLESSEEWHWFEETLSYSNSKLPEALYLAYEITGDQKYLEVAEKTLNFLTELIFVKDNIFLIGQNGWYKKAGKRAFYDQQPVDASSLVQTYLTAHSITQNPEYHKKAMASIHWFYGKNPLSQMVYDETTGGCFDGVGEHSLNMNQGAESTLSYLIARLFIEEAKRNK